MKNRMKPNRAYCHLLKRVWIWNIIQLMQSNVLHIIRPDIPKQALLKTGRIRYWPPSTYAPIISTIQQRGYVLKQDRPGNERKYLLLTLDNSNIKEEIKTEITGAENKLFPTISEWLSMISLLKTLKISSIIILMLQLKRIWWDCHWNMNWYEMIKSFIPRFMKE